MHFFIFVCTVFVMYLVNIQLRIAENGIVFISLYNVCLFLSFYRRNSWADFDDSYNNRFVNSIWRLSDNIM